MYEDMPRDEAKAKRAEISKVVRETTGLSCRYGTYFSDKRKSNHPGNIYGNSMKWWLERLNTIQLAKVNAALQPLGVTCRNTTNNDKYRVSYAVQVFMLQ